MEFRAAAEIDRSSGQAHWGLARSYERLGRTAETIDALRKTVELSPGHLDANVRLGNYYLLVKPPMIAEAEKIVQEVHQKDPRFVEGFVLKASILSLQNKPESEVLSVLESAVGLDPNRTETYIALARYLFGREKTSDAETAIRRGIGANPAAAIGYTEYGRFLDLLGRGPDAEAQFRKAVEVEPKNIDSREALAGFLVAEKQFEKAEREYRDLVSIQENSPESRVELAGFFERTGRRAEAVATLDEIVREQPKFARARYRLTEIHLEAGELEKAAEQTAELIRLDEGDFEALLLRARLSMATGKHDEAVADVQEVLKKLPSHREALFLMAQARLALGQTDQARAFIGDLDKYHPDYLKTGLLRIQAAFAEGDAPSAFRLADGLFRAASGFGNPFGVPGELVELRFRAQSARGLAALELGRLEQARADLTEVQKSAPRSVSALINLAKVSAAAGDLAGALSLFERAIGADARSFEALSGAVSVLTRQKRFADARSRVDAAIALSPAKGTLAALYYLKSDTFRAEGKAAAAESELLRSLETDDGYLPAYSAYASMLAARNEVEAALGQYRKALEKKPSPAVYTLVGMLEEGRGNVSEAEKSYRKALDLDPASPIAANNLAWLIADSGQGNLDEALKLAQSAVNRNPNAAGYLDTLGWVYYKKGLYSPAIEQLRKAVALDEAEAKRNGSEPSAAYRLRLGTALAGSGDKMSARREVEASLAKERTLSVKEIQDAKTLLAQL